MRFSEFEINLASGELRRDGELVKIQDLPFRVLVVLLAHEGQVVTRDQLRAELWGAETFVDAEAGLNTAIAKLREALGDSAASPRFIETLPKRGYRMKMPPPEVTPHLPTSAASTRAREHQSTRAPEHESTRAPEHKSTRAPEHKSTRAPAIVWMRRPLAIATMLVLAVTALGLWKSCTTPRTVTIAVVLFHNETGDPQHDRLAQQLTDGTVVALAANPRYAVIGNAAILRTPRIFADIQKIGAGLRADYLILGQLQSADGRVIVRAHLIRVLDQKHLWAKGIEGDLAGLDSLVPQTVADAVDGALSGAPK
ncbi:MAG: winged helix-turn-helix domain-containing protein [Acidobacteria bacterium]|nr:winged helix-turn-helix domain-containing protein [Acidobacteriota bacterium]